MANKLSIDMSCLDLVPDQSKGYRLFLPATTSQARFVYLEAKREVCHDCRIRQSPAKKCARRAKLAALGAIAEYAQIKEMRGTMSQELRMRSMQDKGGFSAARQPKQIYRRARWKHFTRWLAFLGMVVLDVCLVGSGVHHHLTYPGTLTAQAILKEIIAYTLVGLCNLSVLPSIVVEADSVEVTAEQIIFSNLLFRTAERWEDLTKLVSPPYLKFAILRGKKFFYLINRRDIERFDDLLQIIRHKASNLPK